MMRLLLLATLLCLSSCASAPVFAQTLQCAPTKDAMAYVAAKRLKPILLRGERMRPVIVASGIDMETISFVAIIEEGDGGMAFFGNLDVVCGPVMLSRENINAFLRPT